MAEAEEILKEFRAEMLDELDVSKREQDLTAVERSRKGGGVQRVHLYLNFNQEGVTRGRVTDALYACVDREIEPRGSNMSGPPRTARRHKGVAQRGVFRQSNQKFRVVR